MIKVILSADDFGISRVYNDKILDLLKSGISLSTSVMVNSVTPEQADQVAELADLARSGRVGVGVHLELDPMKPITPQVEDRYGKFNSILGFKPSHVDPHIDYDMGEVRYSKPALWWGINAEIDRFAAEQGIPFRNMGVPDLKLKSRSTTKERYFPARQKWDEIAAYVNGMTDGESYDMMFHPGAADPNRPSGLDRKRDYSNAIKVHEMLKRNPNVKETNYLDL
jgi:predicted glycoside hydrolase/deacetylase ChbG (UPF0249 family)